MTNQCIESNSGTRSVVSSPCTVPNSVLESSFEIVDNESIWARVQCGNTIGQSGWSEWFNGAVNPGCPSQPQNLRMFSRTASSIAIEWDAPASNGNAPITGYSITHQAVGGNVAAQTHQVLSGSTDFENRRYLLSGLTNGQTYQFTIRAFNYACSTGVTATINIIACATPGVPRNVFETISSRDLNTLGIQWSSPLDTTGVTY